MPVTTKDAPKEYDFSGLPSRSATAAEGAATPGTRLLLLLLAPVLGLLVTVTGIVLHAFADHDIAASGSTDTAEMMACVTGTEACPPAETVSQIVYVARDTGTAAIIGGAVLLAVGIALVIAFAIRPNRSHRADTDPA